MTWLKMHPEVVYTDLEEGAVLLHLETKFYYSVNEVGQTIWRLLDSTVRLEELIQRLMAEYEVEESRATASISRFLQDLEREQLVVRVEEDSHKGSSAATIMPASKKPFAEPELIKHDEPLHEVVMNPFDPQLPLAE